MSKTALLLVVDGSEEIEVVVTADVLRRAGICVTIAGVSGPQPVKCSRNVVIVPDKALSDINEEYDVVILPGGLGGAHVMAKSPEVGHVLRNQQNNNRLIAGICAAPVAFKAHGIGLQKQITSHPFRAEVLKDGTFKYLEERVVIDEQLITSRGVGTAFEFALAIVEKLLGINKVNEITPQMILK